MPEGKFKLIIRAARPPRLCVCPQLCEHKARGYNMKRIFFMVIDRNAHSVRASVITQANSGEHTHPSWHVHSRSVLTVNFVVFVLPVLYGHHIQRGSVRKHQSTRFLFDKVGKKKILKVYNPVLLTFLCSVVCTFYLHGIIVPSLCSLQKLMYCNKK